MTRGVAAALGAWTVGAIGWWVFFSSGSVMSCLGPLDVTPESCRAANGLPPETDLERFLSGPGLLILVLVVGWTGILLVVRWRMRQRGGL